jgi:methylated-DNA-[protein]-cysteine S-methyltransferase
MIWYVFNTLWGWAAVLGQEKQVNCTILPQAGSLEEFLHKPQRTGHEIEILSTADEDIPLVNKIRAYYQGMFIENWEVELVMDRLPDFSKKVLEYVSAIPYGHTLSYSEVARAVMNPRAARAVGQVMRRNPIPLIIPCHRVVATSNIGGFTSTGGVQDKEKMLFMEKEVYEKTRLSN